MPRPYVDPSHPRATSEGARKANAVLDRIICDLSGRPDPAPRTFDDAIAQAPSRPRSAGEWPDALRPVILALAIICAALVAFLVALAAPALAHEEGGLIEPAYTYRAELRGIVDGDTIDVDIDLGLRIWVRDERLRLYGIDAPETRTRNLDEKARGVRAKAWLAARLEGADRIIVQTIRDDEGKFGRLLAIIWADGVNLNDEMVALGLARRVEY